MGECILCSIQATASGKWGLLTGFDFSAQHVKRGFMPQSLGFMATSYIWDIRWVITKSPWSTSHIVFSGCCLCVVALWAVKISDLQLEEWFVIFALQLQRTFVYVMGWCYLLVLPHASSIKGQNITKQTMRTLYPWMSLWNREKRSKHTSSALNR